MRHRLIVPIVALLAALSVAGYAAATPEDAYNDFASNNDQEFNQRHSWADLRAAVDLVRIRRADDPSFQAQMAEAVQAEIARRYLGLESAPPSTLDPPVLPPWMIALGTAAIILVLTGIAAAIWRRVRPLR